MTCPQCGGRRMVRVTVWQRPNLYGAGGGGREVVQPCPRCGGSGALACCGEPGEPDADAECHRFTAATRG